MTAIGPLVCLFKTIIYRTLMVRQIGVSMGQNNDGPVLSVMEGLVMTCLYSALIKAHIHLLFCGIQAIAGRGIATFTVQVESNHNTLCIDPPWVTGLVQY